MDARFSRVIAIVSVQVSAKLIYNSWISKILYVDNSNIYNIDPYVTARYNMPLLVINAKWLVLYSGVYSLPKWLSYIFCV